MLSILLARAGPHRAYRLAPALTFVVTGFFWERRGLWILSQYDCRMARLARGR
jgi:hypothetical protein